MLQQLVASILPSHPPELSTRRCCGDKTLQRHANPKPSIQNHKSQTPNPKPQTLTCGKACEQAQQHGAALEVGAAVLHVTCYMSRVTCHVLHVTCYMSRVALCISPHTSTIPPHAPHITRHTSPIPPHPSQVWSTIITAGASPSFSDTARIGALARQHGHIAASIAA
jgi:hypothetical protein